MKVKFYGLFTILLMGATVGIGLYQVYAHSVFMGIVYLAGCLISVPAMVSAYCSKCDCRHMFVGQLTRLLPAIENMDYTFGDYTALILCFIVLFAFRQYWLWKTPMLWAAFSILLVLAGILLWLFVCKGCESTKCQMCVQRNGLTIT